MEETSTELMGAPVVVEDGSKVLPRRAPRGLLPSTWLQRQIMVEYVVGGAVRETTGVLADLFPVGPVLLVGGRRTMISWDSIALVELVED